MRINLSAKASLRCQVASMLILSTQREFAVVLGVEASPTGQIWCVGQTDVIQDGLASMTGYSRQKVNSITKAMEWEVFSAAIGLTLLSGVVMLQQDGVCRRPQKRTLWRRILILT